MSKPRILLTASSFGVGLTFHLTRLAIALNRRGYEVIVISDIEEEIKGLSNELKSKRIKHYRIKGLDAHVSPNSVWELSKIVKTQDIDIVHVFGLIKLTKFYLAEMLLGENKKSIVLHLDSIRDETAIRKTGYTALRRIINSYVDAVLLVSDWTRKRLREYGVREEKMFTVHNAIDLEWFDSVAAKRPSEVDFFDGIKDKTVVTQVSTLYQWKGHEYFLKAAQKVLGINPGVHFLIVGEGPLRQKLQNMANSLKISRNVTFTGHVQNYYVPWILSNIDIGVLASLRENCPRTLLEYMGAQKPIVATEVGGVTEVITNGINGYIVPPANPDLLARAILRLINNDLEARKMRIAGRRIVEENHSIDVFTSKLESVYECLR